MIALLLIGAAVAFLARSATSGFAHVTALDTFNAYLRQGQSPPAFVAQLARAEALSIGDGELAASIQDHFLAAPAPSPSPASPGAPTASVSADLTNAIDSEPMASPIPGVPDEAWTDFTVLLAHQRPDYHSGRRIGRYAASKTRLTEIGIDPETIVGSANAQDMALCADLADAHRHLDESGDLAKYIGKSITLPDVEHPSAISLSGLLGVTSVAGLDGAVSWLTKKDDRKRFPHTTNVFLRTNGVF